MTGFGRWLDAEQFNVNQIGANTRSFVGTTSAGGTIQLGYDRTVFGRANHLVAGVEYAHSDVRPARLRGDDGRARSRVADLGQSERGRRAYAQDTVDIVKDLLRPGDRLVMTVAVRWDWLRHDIDDRSPPSAPAECIGHQHLQPPQPDDRLQPQPLARLGFYFNYAEGFRRRRFSSSRARGPARSVRGSRRAWPPTHLCGRSRPATTRSASAPGPHRGSTRSSRCTAPTSSTTSTPSRRPARLSLLPGTWVTLRRQGIEVSLGVRPFEDLEARLSYAYTDATFQDNLLLATPSPDSGMRRLTVHPARPQR